MSEARAGAAERMLTLETEMDALSLEIGGDQFGFKPAAVLENMVCVNGQRVCSLQDFVQKHCPEERYTGLDYRNALQAVMGKELETITDPQHRERMMAFVRILSKYRMDPFLFQRLVKWQVANPGIPLKMDYLPEVRMQMKKLWTKAQFKNAVQPKFENALEQFMFDNCPVVAPPQRANANKGAHGFCSRCLQWHIWRRVEAGHVLCAHCARQECIFPHCREERVKEHYVCATHILETCGVAKQIVLKNQPSVLAQCLEEVYCFTALGEPRCAQCFKKSARLDYAKILAHFEETRTAMAAFFKEHYENREAAERFLQWQSQYAPQFWSDPLNVYF